MIGESAPCGQTRKTFSALLLACSAAVAQPTPTEPSKTIGPVISGGSSAIALPNPGGEASNPLAGRGGELPAVIRYVISEGVKITSLGEVAGLRTYLGEAANGRFNAFYVAPDGEHLIAGLMFQSGGHNVTNDQIAAMLKRFGDAAKQMPGIDAGLLPSVPESDPKADPKGEFIDWMKSLGMNGWRCPGLSRRGAARRRCAWKDPGDVRHPRSQACGCRCAREARRHDDDGCTGRPAPAAVPRRGAGAPERPVVAGRTWSYDPAR